MLINDKEYRWDLLHPILYIYHLFFIRISVIIKDTEEHRMTQPWRRRPVQGCESLDTLTKVKWSNDNPTLLHHISAIYPTERRRKEKRTSHLLHYMDMDILMLSIIYCESHRAFLTPHHPRPLINRASELAHLSYDNEQWRRKHSSQSIIILYNKDNQISDRI